MAIEDDEAAKPATEKDEFPDLSSCPACPSYSPDCPRPSRNPCPRSAGRVGKVAVETILISLSLLFLDFSQKDYQQKITAL